MRIWVDCTAAAHPLVLRPIIERLGERGHEVLVSAREYGQTVGILERLGIAFDVLGSHGGAGTAAKARALAGRSAALARWVGRRRVDLGLAHGSVDLAVVGALLGVPTVQMQDYEFAGMQRRLSWGAARRVLVPDAIPVERLRRAGARERKLFRYPGLKEDYYLADFEPDGAVIEELGLDRSEGVLVVVRPPPETSAYHAPNSLYERVLDRIAADRQARAVVIPRTAGQGAAVRARRDESLVVPDRAIDAQSLISLADLVVGAGGTMNREAVALGIPVYTIFSGRMGGVDESLLAAGRMRRLADPDELELAPLDRHPRGALTPRDAGPLVEAVLEAVS